MHDENAVLIEQTRLRLLSDLSTIICDVEVTANEKLKTFSVSVPHVIDEDVVVNLLYAARSRIVVDDQIPDFTVVFS